MLTATLTKMPTAEVIGAQASTETAAQVARRLGVKVGFVRNILVSQNWDYAMMPAAEWKRPLRDLRAGIDQRAAAFVVRRAA